MASNKLISAAMPLGKPALSKNLQGEINNIASKPAKQIGFNTPPPTYISTIISVKQSNGGRSLI